MDSENDSEPEGAPVLEKQAAGSLVFDREKSLRAPDSPPFLQEAEKLDVDVGARTQEEPQRRRSKRKKWHLDFLKPQKIPRATRVSQLDSDIPKECHPSKGSHGKDRLYRCNKCPLTSHNAADFMRHYAHHDSGKKLKCRYCDYSGDFLNRVRKHEKIHQKEFVKEDAKCIGQQKVLADPSESAGNSKVTEPTESKIKRVKAKPGSLLCKYCDFWTFGTSEMFFHRCRFHPRTPPVGYFEEVGRKKYSPVRHSIAETVDEVIAGSLNTSSSPSIPANLKIKKTSSKETYPAATKPANADRKVNGSDRMGFPKTPAAGVSLMCRQCPFKTEIKELMKTHQNGHKRSTGYKCPHCSFRVLMYTMLAKHVVLHQKKDGQKVEEASSFPVVTKQRTKVIRKCPHCPHSSAYNIERHIKMHEANGAFKCPHCTFSTDAVGTLNYHKMLHWGSYAKKVELRKVKQESEGTTHFSPGKVVGLELRKREKKCPICPYVGLRNADIRKHLKHHGKPALYKCHFCNFSSNAARAVKVHQTIHNDVASTNGNFPQQTTAVKNVLRPRRRFLCKICKFQTHRQSAARFHRKSHSIRKRYRCRKCTFSAGVRVQVTAHTKVHGLIQAKCKKFGRSGNFRCSICGIKIRSFGGVLVHRAVHHPMGPTTLGQNLQEKIPVKLKKVLPPPEPSELSLNKLLNAARSPLTKKRHCPFCPYRTPHNNDLRKHMIHHSENLPFRCPLCTFSCNASLSLTHHKNMHKRAEKQSQADVQPEEGKASAEPIAKRKVPADSSTGGRASPVYYRCGLCPYTTKHSYDVLAHKKMHEGVRKFSCDICSYSCMRMSAMKTHMKLHTDKTLILRAEYALPASRKSMLSTQKECQPKVIRDISGRKVGVYRIEGGYRVYTCDLCPYRTSMNSNLMSHYRLHAGSRSHKCPNCTFNTSVQRRLDDHLVVHEPSYSESAPLDSPGQLTSGWVPKIRGPYSRSGTEYRCKHCPHTAVSYTSLWYHLQKHKKIGKHQCSLCSFSTGAVACLKRHELVHEKDKSKSEKPEHVLESSSSPSNGNELPGGLQNPEILSENNSTIKEEDDEENESADEKSTELLLSSIEDKNFVEAVVRKEREDNKDPNFRGYMCFKCGHVEKKFGMFRIHRMLHKNSGSRPFQCPHCSLSANHSETLRQHIKERHLEEESSGSRDSRLRCHNCSFAARNTNRLIEHQASHLPEFWRRQREKEKEQRKLRRPATGMWWKGKWKSSNGSLALREYMNFYCPKCCFQCEFLKNYKKHIEKHGKKDGLFMCTICDYSCKHLNVVRFHELNHHSNVPFSVQFQDSTSRKVDMVEELDPEKKKCLNESTACPSECSTSADCSLCCTFCDFITDNTESLKNHWEQHVQGNSAVTTQKISVNWDLPDKFLFLSNLSLLPRKL